jgi:hypothetical protein
MVAKKKLVIIAKSENASLRRTIASNLTVVAERNAALKDCHLIEAALQTENRIVSLDATSRSLFHRVASEAPAVTKIVWIDPTDLKDDAVSWLRQGAPVKGRTF